MNYAVLILSSFLLILSNNSWAGSTTLTTYYPAPSGNYDKVKLTATATASAPTCAAANEGMLFYDSDAHQIKACGDGDGSIGWEGGSGWTMLGTNIYTIGAGNSTMTGNYNFLAGYSAGNALTTGYRNNFIGQQAGYNITTGYDNIFMGYQAGYTNNTGVYNVFLGYQAGKANTANSNTFIGSNSGVTSTTGGGNVMVGAGTGFSNTIGNSNVFIGFSAGAANTTASFNTYIGAQAGNNNTTGTENTYVGLLAGQSNSTGSYNTSTGSGSLDRNTASYNTAFGRRALFSNTTGTYNTSIGKDAGDSSTTNTNMTYLGYGTDASAATGLTNSTAVGNGAIVTASDQVVLGNASVTATTLRGDVTGPTSITIDGSAAAPYILSVGGNSNGRMKVRHIDGKSTDATVNDLYLQYDTGYNVNIGGGANSDLNVNGSLKVTGGTPAAGKFLAATDASGNSAWAYPVYNICKYSSTTSSSANILTMNCDATGNGSGWSAISGSCGTSSTSVNLTSSLPGDVYYNTFGGTTYSGNTWVCKWASSIAGTIVAYAVCCK